MRTLAVAAITSLIALAMASVASAGPSVSFVWTDTTGSGTPGGSSIDAAVGDVLTLDMLVTTDGEGISFASASYNISAAGSVDVFFRPTIDSFNSFDGSVVNTSAPSVAATYTGGSLLFLSGEACPFPATGNTQNLFGENQCFAGTLGIVAHPADLGGGIIGSAAAGPGGAGVSGFTFTLARASFEVVPEPATGGLLALGLGALAFIGRRRA